MEIDRIIFCLIKYGIKKMYQIEKRGGTKTIRENSKKLKNYS